MGVQGALCWEGGGVPGRLGRCVLVRCRCTEANRMANPLLVIAQHSLNIMNTYD